MKNKLVTINDLKKKTGAKKHRGSECFVKFSQYRIWFSSALCKKLNFYKCCECIFAITPNESRSHMIVRIQLFERFCSPKDSGMKGELRNDVGKKSYYIDNKHIVKGIAQSCGFIENINNDGIGTGIFPELYGRYKAKYSPLQNYIEFSIPSPLLTAEIEDNELVGQSFKAEPDDYSSDDWIIGDKQVDVDEELAKKMKELEEKNNET